MKRQLLYLSFFALGLLGCGEKQPEPVQAKPQEPTGGDYLSTITRAEQKAVVKIDTVAIDQAIQQFQVGEGRFPNDLNELVAKKYLRQMPKTPPGKKFEYDAKTGAVKIVAE